MSDYLTQWNLRDLRTALSQFPAETPVVLKGGVPFGAMESWRGEWEEVAIDNSGDKNAVVTVADVLAAIKTRLRKPLTQPMWSGKATLDTALWVDSYDECSYRAVVGAKLNKKGQVRIKTQIQDYSL